MTEPMYQTAPFPDELADLVRNWRYRPGWRAWLERDSIRDPASTHGGEAKGLTLCIYADVMDTYHPDEPRPVLHSFIVPAATYNRASWLRWLFDCLLKIEQHEASEWFVIGEQGHDTRPFAPTHGPGDDPYVIVQYATDEQRRTSFRGVVL